MSAITKALRWLSSSPVFTAIRSWLLWKPERLIAVVAAAMVALLIVVIAVSEINGQHAERESAARAEQQTASPTATGPAPLPTLSVPDVGDPADAAARAIPGGDFELGEADPQNVQDVSDTAQVFTTSWLAGRITDPQQWQTAMAALVVEDLVAFIAATPPEAIPEATVTGVDVDPDTVTPTSGVATVTLSDASAITVRASLTFPGWRVAAYQSAAPQ